MNVKPKVTALGERIYICQRPTCNHVWEPKKLHPVRCPRCRTWGKEVATELPA